MSKRRKLWWISGGVATAFALFVLAAFLIDYNSTDAKFDRAVMQIVEDYGFELTPDSSGSTLTLGGNQRIYQRAAISAEKADEIVVILRSACRLWSYEHIAYDKDLLPVSVGGGAPVIENHSFIKEDTDTGVETLVSFIPNDMGLGQPEVAHATILSVVKFDRPNLWQRIKGMWPW